MHKLATSSVHKSPCKKQTHIIISDESCRFFQNLLVIGHYAFVIHFTLKKQLYYCLLLSPGKFRSYFTKIDSQKRELTNKDENAAKKQKVIMLDIELESYVN